MKMFNISDKKKVTKAVTKADKVWLDNIVKRQRVIVDDLIEFNRRYPDKLNREVVGSLFSLYELISDTRDSVVYRNEEEYNVNQESGYYSFVRNRQY